MLDEASYDTADSAERVYGKYQGTVMNNLDPQGLGRLQAFVPSVAWRGADRLGEALRALWRADFRLLLGAAHRCRRVDRIRGR